MRSIAPAAELLATNNLITRAASCAQTTQLVLATRASISATDSTVINNVTAIGNASGVGASRVIATALLAGVKPLSRVVHAIASQTRATITVADTTRVSDTDSVAAWATPAFLTLARSVLSITRATAVALLTRGGAHWTRVIGTIVARKATVADANVANTGTAIAAEILAGAIGSAAEAVRSGPARVAIARPALTRSLSGTGQARDGSEAFSRRAVAWGVRRGLLVTCLALALAGRKVARAETAVDRAVFVLAEGSEKARRALAAAVATTRATIPALLGALSALAGLSVPAGFARASSIAGT